LGVILGSFTGDVRLFWHTLSGDEILEASTNTDKAAESGKSNLKSRYEPVRKKKLHE
jgi:hypothetical protein